MSTNPFGSFSPNPPAKTVSSFPITPINPFTNIPFNSPPAGCSLGPIVSIDETATKKQVGGWARVVGSALGLIQFYKDFQALCPITENWLQTAHTRFALFQQLRQENPNEYLVPTIDILFMELSFLFHGDEKYFELPEISRPTHLLAPPRAFEACLEKTENLWQSKYATSYLPKDTSPHDVARPPYLAVFGSIPEHSSLYQGISIYITPNGVENIRNELVWMREFFLQLSEACSIWSLSEYDVLVKATYLYERTIQMIKKERSVADVTPVLVDAIWRAHMIAPNLYKSEISSMFGSFLPHVSKKPEDGDFVKQKLSFYRKWKKHFGDDVFLSHVRTFPPKLLPKVDGVAPVGLCEEKGKHATCAIHQMAVCDNCNMVPIRGDRYKCANCPDLDLCSICFANRTHDKRHCFLIMQVPSGAHFNANSRPLFNFEDLYPTIAKSANKKTAKSDRFKLSNEKVQTRKRPNPSPATPATPKPADPNQTPQQAELFKF